MSLIHDDFKESVRARTDLVALIGESVSLQTSNGGREFVGLCPFHDDHRPSMRVYPARQSFRCWVCDTGGDCFAFVMKRENVGFREALEMLAQRANLPLPASYRRSRDEIRSDEKTTLYDALAWAEQQFHECLLRDPLAERARKYVFEERRLSTSTVEQFRLGYHPNHWQWLQNRAGKKFTIEQLQTVWLVQKSERGNLYDSFVDRVIFPIRDPQGRAIGFGGRVLPGSEQHGGKYINSADTPVFHKSQHVYGLDQARLAINEAKSAVLMEGYMDCIAAHQVGIRNAVATLGTALAESHVMLLKRFTNRVILMYDGDDAGQMATGRALARFLAQGVDLRILSLPDQLDPDEYVAERGADALRGLIEQAEDAWDYKLRTSVARHGLGTVIGRQRVLEEMLEILSELPSLPGNTAGNWTLRESLMLTRLVQQLGVREPDLRKQLAELRGRKAGQGHSHAPALSAPAEGPSQSAELFPAKPSADDKAERDLLSIILAAPERLPEFCGVITPAEFRNRNLARLFEVCLTLAVQGCSPSYERVMLATEELRLKQLTAYVADYAARAQVTPEVIAHTLTFFQKRRELTEGSGPLQGPHLKASPESLSQDMESLKQATLRHQKRAGKPT